MRNILKTSVILSAIAGLIAGVLFLIPALQILILILLVISLITGILLYTSKIPIFGKISLITGTLFLILFLKPFIIVSFFVLVGAGMIVYLKKNNLVGFLLIQDGALIGAISGFISLITAAIIYLPLQFIFNLFSGSHLSKLGITSSLMNLSGNLFIIIILTFFVALVLSAPFNAISAMIAAYIYEKIEVKPFDFQTHLEIEQDD